MNWFKRKPKVVITPLDPYEAKVISAHGLTSGPSSRKRRGT